MFVIFVSSCRSPRARTRRAFDTQQDRFARVFFSDASQAIVKVVAPSWIGTADLALVSGVETQRTADAQRTEFHCPADVLHRAARKLSSSCAFR